MGQKSTVVVTEPTHKTGSSSGGLSITHDGGLAGFRADIEGMRGVAVLLVVAFHAGLSICRGGFVGVDVFFVLSGYLITGLLVKEVVTTGRIDMPRFYARRARRLLPASTLMLGVTVCVALFVFSPLEQERLARAAVATAAYMSNIFFLRRSTDYFAPDVHSNPLLHTWSLGVEEQFYLVWPIMISMILKVTSRSQRALTGAMAVVVTSCNCLPG
jgi:peptidoglycan/LPS O-acetylase OafA/YrhL